MHLSIIQTIAVWILPVMFAITLHEVAHGWVASKLGDQTAKLSGRLTLNPLKHIDIIGTLIVPLLMLIFANFIFGWAKPVPVDARNLHHPRRDMAIVAIAGPVSNLIMAVLWACIAKIGSLLMPSYGWVGLPVFLMGGAGIMANVVLAVINLIPFPPLDGGKVAMSLLPNRWAYHMYKFEPYSFLILVILMTMTNLFQMILFPPINFLLNLFMVVFNLPSF
jgi:Zn-dependent protease